jgi:hypothetical protein
VSAECRVCEVGYHVVYNLDAGLDSLSDLLKLAGFSAPPVTQPDRTAGESSKSKLLGKHHKKSF